MARFLAIVALLVIVALAINHFTRSDEETTEVLGEADEVATTAVAEADEEPAGSKPVEIDATQPAAPDTSITTTSPPDVGQEEVMLGIAELTAGVPGTGSLTAERARQWLDDPRNHMVLKPILPKVHAALPSGIATRGGCRHDWRAQVGRSV